MEQPKGAQKFLVGTVLTAGLVALGLAVTGHSARALTLVQGSFVEGFHVLDGSSRSVSEVALNGRPTTIQVCYHPSKTPDEILAHYAKVAHGESPANAPYLVEENPDGGGSVIWVTLEGERKAVLVASDPRGGAEFRLIAEAPVEGRPTREAAPQDAILPGGVAAPDGFRLVYCLAERDGTGTAILEAPGEGRDAAAGVLTALSERGFVTRSDLRAAYADHTPDTRLTIPFAHRSGALAGHLVVSPNETGGARVCLTVREGS